MIGNEVLLSCTITVNSDENAISDKVEWLKDGKLIDFKNTKS